MNRRVLLVSVPFADVEQTEQEREYWKWHYALKAKHTYRNLTEDQLFKLGNIEHQNIGLLSIASYLAKHGVEVKYMAPSSQFASHDRENVFLQKVLDNIDRFDPDFIGFSAITYNMPIAFEYGRAAKHKKPGIKTVIGGAHANGVTAQTLDELLGRFDYVIRGKGEKPLLSLINGVVDAPGISCRDGGQLIANPTCMSSVNNYPDPLYGLLDVEDLPAARVYSSLGCRSKTQCIFCGDILHNKDFVVKQIDTVIDEIRYLHERHASTHFFFGDENFFFNKQRAMRIMDAINASGLDISVGYQVRIEDADEELIRKASEHGRCSEIHCGVESLSQEVLNLNNKGLRIEQVKDFCRLTKRYGISNHCYFLTGLPGETEETALLTMKKMVEFIDEGLIDMVEYRIAMPYPGTPMAESPDKFGVKIKHRDWEYYKGERMPPFDLETLPAERIYELYLQGIERITDAYKNRFTQCYGGDFLDLKALGPVISGGF